MDHWHKKRTNGPVFGAVAIGIMLSGTVLSSVGFHRGPSLPNGPLWLMPAGAVAALAIGIWHHARGRANLPERGRPGTIDLRHIYWAGIAVFGACAGLMLPYALPLAGLPRTGIVTAKLSSGTAPHRQCREPVYAPDGVGQVLCLSSGERPKAPTGDSFTDELTGWGNPLGMYYISAKLVP